MTSTKRQVMDSYYGREKEFVEEVLKPLFGNLGYEVNDNQGAQEFGKDLVLKKSNPLRGIEVTAVAAKAVDINNTGKGKSSGTVDEVRRQVDQCWKMPINKFGLKEVIPNSVVVVTCGTISNNAQVELTSSLEQYNKSNTIYIERDALIKLIDEHYRELWSYELPVLSKYLLSLRAWVEKKTMYQSVFKDGIDFVGITCVRRLRTAEGLAKHDISKPKEILKPNTISWLQGGTGSGKTFTTWHLCELALNELKGSRKEKRQPKNFKIPVYVKARDLKSLMSDSKDQLISWIKTVAHEYAPDITPDEIVGWIQEHGCDLVVDEFELSPLVQQVDNVLNALLKLNPSSSVLLLSRFTDEVKYEFKSNPQVWYLKEINLAAASRMIASAGDKLGGKANQAYKEFVRDGMLQKLPRTPLALNVLRLVFEEQIASLPNNIYEFFDMFFEIVLGRWERDRETSRPFDYKQLRSFLQRVAYRMTEKRVVEIDVADIKDVAEDVISSAAVTDLSADDYIVKVATIGDICRIDNGKFQFVQRTYQEFLAGCEFFQHYWNHDAVLERFTDIHWEDSIVFAAGAKCRDDELLKKLPTKYASNHFELFYKMKNIGLLSQALYQSNQTAKEVAILNGAKCAVRLRDNEDLIKRIKTFAPSLPDIYITYMMMKLFSLFYGRTTLQTSIEALLSGEGTSREGYYLVTALANMNSPTKKLDVPKAMKALPTVPASPESMALGGFLKQEATESGGTQIKKIVESKKVRRLANKTNKILASSKSKEGHYSVDSKRRRS